MNVCWQVPETCPCEQCVRALYIQQQAWEESDVAAAGPPLSLSLSHTHTKQLQASRCVVRSLSSSRAESGAVA
jgi:hypothetical protein